MIVKKKNEKGKNSKHKIDLFLYDFGNLNISIILYSQSFGLNDFLCISNLYTRDCPLGWVYFR